MEVRYTLYQEDTGFMQPVKKSITKGPGKLTFSKDKKSATIFLSDTKEGKKIVLNSPGRFNPINPLLRPNRGDDPHFRFEQIGNRNMWIRLIQIENRNKKIYKLGHLYFSNKEKCFKFKLETQSQYDHTGNSDLHGWGKIEGETKMSKKF